MPSALTVAVLIGTTHTAAALGFFRSLCINFLPVVQRVRRRLPARILEVMLEPFPQFVLCETRPVSECVSRSAQSGKHASSPGRV